MNLDFLKNVTLAEGKSLAVKQAKPRASIDKNPVGLRIRLFKNGEVYPSEQMVAKYNLEYVAKDNPTIGNGLDIVDTRRFPNYLKIKQSNPGAPDMILVAMVPKSEPKIDLFGTCTYITEADITKSPEDNSLVLGEPAVSVLEQGSKTFGQGVFIELLESLYGFKFAENQKFVDLEVQEDYPVTSPDGIYFVPKTIARGENKGKEDLVRRENVTFFPLTIVETEASVKSEPTGSAEDQPGVTSEVQDNTAGTSISDVSDAPDEAKTSNEGAMAVEDASGAAQNFDSKLA